MINLALRLDYHSTMKELCTRIDDMRPGVLGLEALSNDTDDPVMGAILSLGGDLSNIPPSDSL